MTEICLAPQTCTVLFASCPNSLCVFIDSTRSHDVLSVSSFCFLPADDHLCTLDHSFRFIRVFLYSIRLVPPLFLFFHIWSYSLLALFSHYYDLAVQQFGRKDIQGLRLLDLVLASLQVCSINPFRAQQF